ncbi:uncharacterized protein LOC127095042 [Lathyrus oleraceus]|uniref:uncharacterized protein LOC127095042 n=1 Tax=Pisum sativum TaxID=3888 RepID=UPI0021D31ADC|nr:uncharacterized protein LOC127095042 [Pisum sativum]
MKQDFEYDIFFGATPLEQVPCNRSLNVYLYCSCNIYFSPRTLPLKFSHPVEHYVLFVKAAFTYPGLLSKVRLKHVGWSTELVLTSSQRSVLARKGALVEPRICVGGDETTAKVIT